jgi:hypothetical protein
MTTYTVTTPETRNVIQYIRLLRSVGGHDTDYDRGLVDLGYLLTGIPHDELRKQCNMDPA